MAAAAKARRRAARASTKTARFPTADGRARFADAPYTADGRDASTRAIRFALNTGRLRDQWHGMSRTGTVARLFNHAGEPRLAMHAQRHGAPPSARTATSRV